MNTSETFHYLSRPGFVRMLRKDRAWTQDNLAYEAHVGIRTIQRIEQYGPVDAESVRRVAKVLGCPEELLLNLGTSQEAAERMDAEIQTKVRQARENVELVSADEARTGGDLWRWAARSTAWVQPSVDELQDAARGDALALLDYLSDLITASLADECSPSQAAAMQDELGALLQSVQQHGLHVSVAHSRRRIGTGEPPMLWDVGLICIQPHTVAKMAVPKEMRL